jgi:hypothetical protein
MRLLDQQARSGSDGGATAEAAGKAGVGAKVLGVGANCSVAAGRQGPSGVNAGGGAAGMDLHGVR